MQVIYIYSETVSPLNLGLQVFARKRGVSLVLRELGPTGSPISQVRSVQGLGGQSVGVHNLLYLR